MSRTQTAEQLVNRIRELGEIRATYVTNASLVAEINQSRLELLGKLVDAGAADYFETTVNVNVVSGTASYQLPTNHFSTLGVDVMLSDGSYFAMDRYNMQDRNLLSDDDVYQREDVKYRLRGDYITFSPTPDWTETNGIRHVYVSVPTDINASNALSGQNVEGFWGWEDYIVYDCLVKFIGGKEEGDATQWEKMLMKTSDRIDEMKNNRDRANPDTIANVDYEFRRARRVKSV